MLVRGSPEHSLLLGALLLLAEHGQPVLGAQVRVLGEPAVDALDVEDVAARQLARKLADGELFRRGRTSVLGDAQRRAAARGGRRRRPRASSAPSSGAHSTRRTGIRSASARRSALLRVLAEPLRTS